ncbi:MAG: hypothetical protein AB1584_01060 [Pseudomonadota bacterium]
MSEAAPKQKRTPKIIFGDHEVSVSHLHLDPLNPRHDPLEGDAEVIAQLCNAEMVAELAQDIAKRGALSPLERMGVVPFDGHPGHYITVEGNRRTCALILLSDPSRAPTPALQAQLRRLSATSKAPTRIKVHVFADRAAAKPWIDMRHLGRQGGIGTLEWDAAQKTRAAGDNTQTSARANTLALAVLDRLVHTGQLTAAQREKVRLTTVTRYLGTPGVRAILGLGSANDLVFTHAPEEVMASLRQLVLDSIEPQVDGNFAVNSRSGSAQRLAYANQLKSRGLAPVTPLTSATPIGTSGNSPVAPTRAQTTESANEGRASGGIPPNDVAAEPIPEATTTQAKKRSGTDPAKLRTLFDSSFLVETRDPVLLRLRQEALNLPLEEFAFSGNYLLRAIVEQVMVLFARKRGKYSPGMPDHKLTLVCAAEFKSIGGSGKALNVLEKVAGNQATPYGLHSLGNAIHGGIIPTKRDLRAYADTWIPALRGMLDALC